MVSQIALTANCFQDPLIVEKYYEVHFKNNQGIIELLLVH
jgi:hypothetical protein